MKPFTENQQNIYNLWAKTIFCSVFSFSYPSALSSFVHQFQIVIQYPPHILFTRRFLSISFFVFSSLLLTALQSALHHSHQSAFALVWSPSPSEGIHSLISAWQKPPYEEIHSTFYSRCVCVSVCEGVRECVRALKWCDCVSWQLKLQCQSVFADSWLNFAFITQLVIITPSLLISKFWSLNHHLTPNVCF